MFSPYHIFSNASPFKRTFGRLNSAGRVDSSALHLLDYFDSVETKLKSSMYHLDTILAIDAIVVDPPYDSGTTGTTIPLHRYSTEPATSVSPVTEDDISRELGNFFYNIESAFESFAQLMNCIYPSPTLTARNVTFTRKSDEMGSIFLSETLTNYITSMRAKQWYKDMKRFRRCEYHRKSIPFCPIIGHIFKNNSWQMMGIWLPDNPAKKRITFLKKRDFDTVGTDVFTEALKGIDDMFGVIEARITLANHIPI